MKRRSLSKLPSGFLCEVVENMTDKKEMLAPQIRFNGYTNAWGQRKLGEVGDVVTGSTPSTNNAEYYNGEYIFVSPADIQENRYVNETTTTLTKTGFDSGRKIRNGSTLFVCIGSTIGKVGQAGREVITNQQINSVIANEAIADDDFVFSLLQMRSPRIKELAATQAVPIINKSTFSDVDVNLPSLSEQTAIGNFFRTLDNALLMQKRKCEGLRKLKVAYLQQMFPQNGESVPRLRFGGFTREWKIAKAGEIFISVSEKNHPKLPVLSASQEKGMVLRDEIGIDIKFDENALGTYKKILPGQFAIHLRSFQGGFAHSTIEGITSPAYTILDFENQNEHDSDFWKEVFTSKIFIKRLETITYGIRDGRSISFTEFSTLTMPYPTHEEQLAIGNFFCSLDMQTSTHQAKLNKLKHLKQALLQKMFV